MTDASKPRRETLQDLLDSIEDGDWVVTDYDPTLDPHDSLRATITVEHDPETTTGVGDLLLAAAESSQEQRERVKVVKRVIASLAAAPGGELDGGHEDGAPRPDVIDRVFTELDGEITVDEIEETIHSLKQQGEVCEPVEGVLRTT